MAIGLCPFLLRRAGAAGWRALLVLSLLVVAGMPRANAAAIAITQPANEETIHSNQGQVSVAVRVTDAAPGSRVRLNVDGVEQAQAAGSGVIALHGIDRGTHVLRAELLGGDGSVLARSAPVTIYLWHASRLNPPRRP